LRNARKITIRETGFPETIRSALGGDGDRPGQEGGKVRAEPHDAPTVVITLGDGLDASPTLGSGRLGGGRAGGFSRRDGSDGSFAAAA
jgi:hypothetical protein